MFRKVNTVARWALPVGFGLVGLAIGLGGGLGASAWFGLASGLALGLTLYCLVVSHALLLGHYREPPVLGRHLQDLEEEKQLVLRSIKEIELDARLQQTEQSDVETMTEPLRQRAVRLMRELDRARVLDNESVTEQIEHEVRRRRLLEVDRA